MGQRKPKGGKPKKKGKRTETPEEIPGLASMERTISGLTDILQGPGVGAPGAGQAASRQAQELIYDAWEMPRKQDRIRLAEEALKLWPDCADAYCLLGEEMSRSVSEACRYFEKAVQAGERALGPAVFAEDVGHFWGILETRPYMRARAGLAESLWSLGEEEEALEHYQDMIRLNPSDNQGIRDLLLTRLLKRGEQEKAGQLLKVYSDDGSANWLYNRALLLFREQGDSAEATAALDEALEQNGHVPAYLLAEKKVPKELPDYIGWGDESEAHVYAADAEPVWRATEGARGWLLRGTKKRR